MKLEKVFDVIQGHQITDEELYVNEGKIPVITGRNQIKGYWNSQIIKQEDLPCITYPTKANIGEAYIQTEMFDANNTAVLISKPEYKELVDLEWVSFKLGNGSTPKLFEAKLYEPDTKKELSDLKADNLNDKSNVYLFRLGLIRHDDLDLFSDGKIDSLWKYVNGENSGLLSRTHFGIFLDDSLKKVFLIKESGFDTLGIASVESYLLAKSKEFQRLTNSDTTIKFIPEAIPDSFDANDIKHLSLMRVGIKSEVVEEYRNKRGQRDVFLRALLNMFPSVKSSKNLEFDIKFMKEGNEEAIKYFNEFYGSFVSEVSEDIQKAIQNFKIIYDSKLLKKTKSVNFVRSSKSFYEVEVQKKGEASQFDNIKDALNWYKTK